MPQPDFREIEPTDEYVTWNRPDARVLGFPCTGPQLLAESPYTTAILASMEVFLRGVELRLIIELFRRPHETNDDWRAWEDRLRSQAGSDIEGSSAFRLSLTVGDGYTTSSDALIPENPLDHVPLSPVMVRLPDRGRSGNRRTQAMQLRLWSYPRPPSGHVQIRFDWPSLGLGESVVDLGFIDFDALSTRALRLRPEAAALDD